MTTEQEQALIDSLQDLQQGAKRMVMHVPLSDQDFRGKTQFHEGRADAFAEVLALLKLAGVKVERKMIR